MNPLNHFIKDKSLNERIMIPCKNCKKNTEAYEERGNDKVVTKCRECYKPYSIREYGSTKEKLL